MGTRTDKSCTRCNVVKPLTDFSPRLDRPCGYTAMCRQCLAKNSIWRYANLPDHREKQRAWSKKTYGNLKSQVIESYGGKCKCCGETEPKFLTIDHIYGDGAESRRNGEGQGGSLYLKLKREGFPKDRYQLLCFNCNCSKQQFGECPHQTNKRNLAVTTVATA